MSAFTLVSPEIARTKLGLISVGDCVVIERQFGAAETGTVVRFYAPAGRSSAYPLAEIRLDGAAEDDLPAYVPLDLIEDRRVTL